MKVFREVLEGYLKSYENGEFFLSFLVVVCVGYLLFVCLLYVLGGWVMEICYLCDVFVGI